MVPTKTNRSPINELANEQASLSPRFGSVLTAFLAILVVYFFRTGHSRWALKLVGETVLFTVLPLIIFFAIRSRVRQNTISTMSRQTLFRFQVGAILIGTLVIAWHFACRQLGIGSAYEIIALLTIQNVGWYLAIFSKVPGFEKTSFLLCGFTAFFVCCVTDQFEVFVVMGLYAFVGLWWLLGQYWNRLNPKAIDGKTRSLRLHGAAMSVTTIAVGGAVCIAAAIPFAQSGVSLAGFMPFSGGEEGSEDVFALSGIGDGNMLTAGVNATTTGAVDSDQVIESHKPSLYDMISERYNGPVVKRPRGKAIPLAAIAKHIDGVKQSEQTGKTFRTMRNTDKTTSIELDDRTTDALFFVEGSAPARFAINILERFDGWDWSQHGAIAKHHPLPKLLPQKDRGPDVFGVAQKAAGFLTGRRQHCVKIMRLESDVIPAPPFLKCWQIPKVDQPTMFRWNDAGLLCVARDSIPSQTMINVESLVPNYHLLRSIENVAASNANRSDQKEESPFLQIPRNAAAANIQSMAENWTCEVDPGWKQVEAIVDHMRNDFQLNPAWETSEEADNTVDQFLQQGGGPSYMFATTCAMVLRAAGFETRLVNGFLVRKSDYDSRSNQSIVFSDNLHMWPEVRLDGKFWIPVEPTPDCPIPYSTQTAWQWFTMQVSMLAGWILANPITTLIWIGTSICCVIFRANIATSLMFAWWSLVRLLWPQGLLKATCRLIDLRFWLAGDRRPASETVHAWYARVEPQQAGPFFELWNAKNYSDAAQVISKAELVRCCRNSVDSLTLKRIRDFTLVKKEDQ